VLGLDEHTAALVDMGGDLVQVRGRGVMTVRRCGESVVVPSGQMVTLTDLRALVRGEAAGPAARPADANEENRAPEAPPMSLRDVVVGCEDRFAAGLRGGDAEALVRAVLDIDAAVAQWAGDTEEHLLHSTSWRHEPAGRVLLTYACCPDPRPDLAAVPLLGETPAQGDGPASPSPGSPRIEQVAAHAVRHLALLRHTDAIARQVIESVPGLPGMLASWTPVPAGQLPNDQAALASAEDVPKAPISTPASWPATRHGGRTRSERI
jgi:hypothetical protein